MHVTEMLITGFDGDEPVFAVNLASAAATTDSTGAVDNGKTVVNEWSQLTTDAFEAIYKILDRLPKVSGLVSQGSNL